jgi:hypothetical protein
MRISLEGNPSSQLPTRRSSSGSRTIQFFGKYYMNKLVTAAFGASLVAALAFAPILQPSASTTASAQTTTVQTTTVQTPTGQTVVIDQSPQCGDTVSGQWTPNGKCREFADCGVWTADGIWAPNGLCAKQHMRLTGVITIVKGSMVTIQQSDHTITINDKPALNNEMTGRVAVGRTVTVHGFWQDGTFFATSIDSVL